MEFWTPNDWLELADASFTILGIVVSTIVAYWIVISIQKRISDEQSFKAYLTNSLQQIKGDYHSSLQQLVIGKAHAQDIRRDLYSYDKLVKDIMSLIVTKYPSIDIKYFDSWIIKTRSGIENMPEYSEAYRTNKLVRLTQQEQEIVNSYIKEFDDIINNFIILLYKQ